MRRRDSVVGSADGAVFAALYPQLRRFAAVAAPVEIDPDDLVQDALERTLRVRSLSSLTNPRAYLFRTMRNLASNHRRRLGRARRASVRAAERDGLSPTYPSDVAELLRLSVPQRTVLFLRDIEQFSTAEVGEMLGMSPAAVEKSAQRARLRLRTALREQEVK